MVLGPVKFYAVRDRSAGFIQQSEQSDLLLVVIESNFIVRGGYDAMVQLLQHSTAPIRRTYRESSSVGWRSSSAPSFWMLPLVLKWGAQALKQQKKIYVDWLVFQCGCGSYYV